MTSARRESGLRGGWLGVGGCVIVGQGGREKACAPQQVMRESRAGI